MFILFNFSIWLKKSFQKAEEFEIFPLYLWIKRNGAKANFIFIYLCHKTNPIKPPIKTTTEKIPIVSLADFLAKSENKNIYIHATKRIKDDR